jgi:hypothetical protein
MEDSNSRCTNCNSDLLGQYCHQCGQKHQAHKHSFGYLMLHFIGDFFHFDAQFFNTMKPLFTRPGLVPLDYVEGKRKRHLDPIKMYVFVSIVFFALFFTVVKVNEIGKKGDEVNLDIQIGPKDNNKDSNSISDSTQIKELESALDKTMVEKMKANDSILSIVKSHSIKDSVNAITENAGDLNVDISKDTIQADSTEKGTVIKDVVDDKEMTVKEYEEWQRSLPKEERHGYFKYTVKKKIFEISEAGKQNNSNYFYKVFQSFVVALPKMIFILLPIFALLFKVLYVRLKIYYVDHIVFTVYFFSFFYILFSMVSVSILIEDTLSSTGSPNNTFSDSFMTVALIWIFLYLLFAMKRFYNQSWMKTFSKYVIFLFLSFFISVIGFSIGFVATLFFT